MSAPAAEPAEAVLLAQVRAHRRAFRSAALLLLVVCVGGAAALYFGFDATEERVVKGILQGAVLGPIISLLLFLKTVGDPRKHRAVVALLDHASSVVWLYLEVPTRPAWTLRPGGRPRPGLAAEATLLVCLEDGKRLRFEVQAGDEDRVLAVARSLAPRAVVGFFPAVDEQFRKRPGSVGRPTV